MYNFQKYCIDLCCSKESLQVQALLTGLGKLSEVFPVQFKNKIWPNPSNSARKEEKIFFRKVVLKYCCSFSAISALSATFGQRNGF